MVEGSKPASLIIDSINAEVVTVAAKALAEDIADIISVHPNVSHNLNERPPNAIIFGTVGKSALVDKIIDDGKFDAYSIRGKWRRLK